uniref:Uncharacterized protein n=1 Tax=Gasterosteus aculeatus TaxID=69293 RepID=G3NCT3_GASAC
GHWWSFLLSLGIAGFLNPLITGNVTESSHFGTDFFGIVVCCWLPVPFFCGIGGIGGKTLVCGAACTRVVGRLEGGLTAGSLGADFWGIVGRRFSGVFLAS